ncbi:ectoine utilization protein EutC [Rhizobium mongolense]|uniref:Ornithine cyclodeaminase n=2 Tax=Rhizobium mongolense TaxID=57676 RepID=A0ABR6IYG1_9HYPH|nr:ectoine utilization protein EutC [Rhizobium mongolense]MBB4232958.1 ornithine cyclodeaminase [Rhizobium mongolense]TVZ75100.1 ornithine cyclodeaminase [Rhizobium mongolense USDA 1844]
MPTIKILAERELREIVPLDLVAVQCVERAFHSLATNTVAMPPILRLDISEHRGEVDVKTAYVHGLDGFAVKISPGFFDNPKVGLPSTSGLMVLLSSKTGLLQALLLDNGYLTNVRTAAAGAVAARYLTRKDASVAAILGAGIQARLQLQALTLVRPIREARIWARNASQAEALARELSRELGIPVTAFAKAIEAVAGSDIIVTTTPADQPILSAAWLEPGQHVTAIGSDAEHKNEVEPTAIVRADLYVADSLRQTRTLGELHHAIAAGIVAFDASFPELGEIIDGTKMGRLSQKQTDLTGTGIRDTAIASLALERAEAAGAGSSFES